MSTRGFARGPWLAAVPQVRPSRVVPSTTLFTAAVIAAAALVVGGLAPGAAPSAWAQAPVPADPAARAAGSAPTSAPLGEGVPSGSAQQLFEDGNALYYQGEYDEAARTYGRVLAEYQVEDPVLYHNLGNAYFRTGAFGSAILYYRRALGLEASDEIAASLRRNLTVTRQALRERYAAESDGSQFIYAEPGGVFYRITHILSERLLAVLLLLSVWALAALLALYRLRGDGRGFGAAAAPVAVAAALVAFVLAARVHGDLNFRVGVIVADQVTLREGPHADARGVAIPEGMEVRIVEDAESWTRIELSSGREGWVDAATVKQI